MTEELETEPGQPENEDETQWLERRLDAMDAVLQSLTQQLEAMPPHPSLNPLTERLEALQKKMDTLTVPTNNDQQMVTELQAKITDLETKIALLTPQQQPPQSVAVESPVLNIPVRTLRKL